MGEFFSGKSAGREKPHDDLCGLTATGLTKKSLT